MAERNTLQMSLAHRTDSHQTFQCARSTFIAFSVAAKAKTHSWRPGNVNIGRTSELRTKSYRPEAESWRPGVCAASGRTRAIPSSGEC